MENLFIMFFFVVFIGVIIYFIYQLKTKGLKGAAFGQTIKKELAEISAGEIGGSHCKILLVQLENDNYGRTQIGLGIEYKSFAGYQLMPVFLTTASARRLAEALMSAANADG